MKEFSANNLTWGREIVEKYPLIYLERSSESHHIPEVDSINLRYGFEFGEGWSEIVEEFSEKVTELIIAERVNRADSYIHSCIFKEKFGKLLFQGTWNVTEATRKKLFQLINDLEEKSLNVCEICGKPSDRLIKTNRWAVRCALHSV